MTPETAPTDIGVIIGGWEFVTAAYVITWLTFGGYALSLWIRARRQQGETP